MKIDLGVFEQNFCGLIVPEQTGVIWRTQAGGTHCAHPEMVGFFVPLPAMAGWAKDPFEDRYMTQEAPGSAWEGDAYPKELIDETLKAFELRPYLKPLDSWEDMPAGMPRLAAEAWIPVRVIGWGVRGDLNWWADIFRPLAIEQRVVILTYPNSD